MRTFYQVLMFPYKKEGELKFALFKRGDLGVWQGISGGGEDGETPRLTAQREISEETSLTKYDLYPLSSLSTIPVTKIGRELSYGKEIIMIPEFTFGIELKENDLEIISDEHIEFGWFGFEDAIKKLTWDSNKSALWELNFRLTEGSLSGEAINREIIKDLL